MKINNVFRIIALITILVTFSRMVKAAKIESVSYNTQKQKISVEGISSTEAAVLEITEKNSDKLQYIALIDETDENGKFVHTFNIKEKNGYYVVRLNDGISEQTPDERTIYVGNKFLADHISLNSDTFTIGKAGVARTTVSNLTEEGGTVRFFVAFYTGDGKLSGVKSVEKTVKGQATEEIELSFEIPADSKIKTVKTTLWDEEQHPLTRIAEAEVLNKAVYVSLMGDDENNGTIDSPFKTIERALSEKETDVIYLREGRYFVDSLVLNYGNSGTVIAGYDNEEVILTNSTILKSDKFQLVSESDNEYSRLSELAKGKIYKCNLNELNISPGGVMPNIKMWSGVSPFDIVTVDNKKLHVSRYPNAGYDNIERVISCTGDNMIFKFSGQRPKRWIDADDAWLIGYWGKGWAQDAVKISGINMNLRFITTEGASSYGLTATFPGGQYYAYNLLEELDSEEEWFIDKSSNTIYLYSDTGLTGKEIKVNTERKSLFVIENATDISIRNITIEDVKGYGINAKNCTNVSVKDCTVRNIGQDAIVMTGTECGVENCEIYNIDGGGISLTGGNRNLLEHSGNYAKNNNVHDCALEYRVYRPGIRVDGVGCIVANNEIYNLPHSAIMYNGNEHTIEYNVIRDCLTETTDAGAIYSGQDFLSYGTVIRYNYIENIDTESDPVYGHAVGIYLDDYYAGAKVYGNIMNNVDVAFQLGGGRSNIFTNNIIMNAPRGAATAILADRRDGESWSNSRTTIMEKTQEIDYTNDRWTEKYPQVIGLMEDEPEIPKYNELKNNIIYRHGECNIDEIIKSLGKVENNISLSADDLGFVDEVAGNFKLREDSIIFIAIPEFENIPFEKIGRQK